LANQIFALIKPYQAPILPIPLKFHSYYLVINPETDCIQQQQRKLQTTIENTILKVSILAIRWLKYAKILKFDEALQ
jgi:hypothetical protein